MKFYKNHKQTIDILLIILFWSAIGVTFLCLSLLRPYCVQHPYKELLSALFVMGAVAGSRRIAFPYLFRKGRRTAFWLVSAALLLLSAGAELLTVKNELAVCNPYIKEIPTYLFSLFLSLLARNAGIFSFRMLFALQSYYEGRLQAVSTDTDYPDSLQIDIKKKANSCPTEIQPETGTEQEGNPAEEDLSELESRLLSIFEIVKQNPGCNSRFIAAQFSADTSNRSIERFVAELRKQGKIQYTGSKKTGGYMVVGAAQEVNAAKSVC